MIVKLVLVLSIAVAIRAAEVYYDRLGWFTDDPPYCGTLERPICHLPQDPKQINTQFFLFTRQNTDKYQIISALNVSSVIGTNFDPKKNSIFIVHGAFEWGDKPWLVEMSQAFLSVSDVNCFCVDWRGGSFALYTQSANNIRVVGAEIAYFLTFLKETLGYDMLKVHLIGHSLGAHVVGDAGQRKRGIGRLTGLDAAGPYFENTPCEVRLDPTDGIFVDGLHTDGPTDFHIGFGMQQTVGNVDHYANGGKNNPGCEKTTILLENIDKIIEGAYDAIFCNHQRSVKFFNESITNLYGFLGYHASIHEDFLKGSGFPCKEGSCAYMGPKAEDYVLGHYGQDSTENHIFFFSTGEPPNSPRWRYHVSCTMTVPHFVTGSISVALCGNNGCSSDHEIYSGTLSSGTQSSFIDVEIDVNPVSMVTFSWRKDILFIFQSKLSASAVTVQHGPSGDTWEFCGGNPTEEDTSQIMETCSTG